MRILNVLDRVISGVDISLRTLLPPQNRVSNRPSPAAFLEEGALNGEEKRHSAGLMRVNHAGEVCAQALYQGQALTARLAHVKHQMQEAAEEETDHLAWCEARLGELGERPSILNPLWYGGSLLLGALAGIAGDKISLGFVAETEKQVSRHLRNHLGALPCDDHKSRAIIQRMQDDEEHHADTAIKAGAKELPAVIKVGMSYVSRLMTSISYYL